MIRRPPRSTPKPSSAASDVYKRQNISKPVFFLKSLKGIEFVRMTGSGSSFVAYCKSKKNLLNASKLFTNKYKKYWSVMSKTI